VTLNQSGMSPSFTNSGTISVAGGKTFQVNNGGFTHSSGGTWNGAGSVVLSGVTVTLAADFSEAVAATLSSSTVNGSGRTWTNGVGGVLTLTSSTVNTGLTNGGTLNAVNGESAINGTLLNQAGAMLRVNGTDWWSTLAVVSGTNHGTIELTSTSGAQHARMQGGALTNASDGVINVLAGSGGLRYWNADLTNQGTVTVSRSLLMEKASAVHANSGTIQVNENVTLNQSGTNPSFTNSGTISVAGGKTMTVSSGTFTNAQGGILQGTGTINVSNATFSNAGNINPGTSPGILNFVGNVPQTSTGAINIEIGGVTVGTQYDRVSASETVTFAGSLNVSLVGGFSPNVGDSFTIVTYGSRTGTFGITNFPPLTGGKAWSLSYNATSAVLAVVFSPGVFNKSSPANEATGQTTNPSLSWGASSGATSYEYCYDTSNNSICDGSWISVGSNLSVGLSGLTAGTTYYWQVRARNVAETTEADSGTWWKFSTVKSNAYYLYLPTILK